MEEVYEIARTINNLRLQNTFLQIDLEKQTAQDSLRLLACRELNEDLKTRLAAKETTGGLKGWLLDWRLMLAAGFVVGYGVR